jgi:hypothetical protein
MGREDTISVRRPVLFIFFIENKYNESPPGKRTLWRFLSHFLTGWSGLLLTWNI